MTTFSINYAMFSYIFSKVSKNRQLPFHLSLLELCAILLM